jgi:hypothetical protein
MVLLDDMDASDGGESGRQTSRLNGFNVASQRGQS